MLCPLSELDTAIACGLMTDISTFRPVEIHQVQLRPADFFTANPAIDVPSNRNLASKEMENGVTPNNDNQNGQTCCHRTNDSTIDNGVVNGNGH